MQYVMLNGTIGYIFLAAAHRSVSASDHYPLSADLSFA
jgi:endonuclease/exonuclease/phosphatase family metal-dependent hydrolase